MTPKLAMYTRMARHHLDGTAIDEEDRISLERERSIDGFMILIARKMDAMIRLEVFSRANWLWDTTGPAVQFSVDGQSFLLAQQGKDCHLFLEASGNKIPLAVLSDEDRQFEDHFLVEIGDALGKNQFVTNPEP